MFLRRRGVEVAPRTKRLLYFAFVLSFVLAFLSLHAAEQPSYIPNGVTGYAYPMIPLGIPLGARDAAMVVTGLLGGAAALWAMVLLLRVASLRTIAPTLLLLASQALWFSLPVIFRNWGLLPGAEAFGITWAQYAFLWIAVTHSLQYIWISLFYYATATDHAVSHATFFLRALFVGIAIWTVPALVFAPGRLGRLPYQAGLWLLVASLVNIHHFMLGGVIWKLRYRPIASVLIRAAPAADDGAAHEPSRRWLSPRWATVAVIGVACVSITFVGMYERSVVVPVAGKRGDIARLETASERLDRVGRADPELRTAIGQAYLQRGDLDHAASWLDASIALYPTAAAWQAKGFLHQRAAAPAESAAAFDAAVALDPSDVSSLAQAAVGYVRLGEMVPAYRRLERARKLAPDDHEIRSALESVREHIGAAGDAPAEPAATSRR